MCERAIYMARGKVVADGTTEEVTHRYEQDSRLQMSAWAEGAVGSDPAKCPIQFTDVEVLDESGLACSVFDFGARLRLRLHYRASEPVVAPNFTVSFIRASDEIACCCHTTALDGFATGVVEGEGAIEVVTPPLKLVADAYNINLAAWDSTFERLYCSQVGKSFHVKDPLLNTEFGIFHEPAEWNWPNAPVRDMAKTLTSTNA
jgi:lipopolysaccharide transport system ATP-binding protein